MPLSLLETLAAGRQRADIGGLPRPLAVGVDIRTRDFDVKTVLAHHAALMDVGNGRASILFLDCNNEELRQRYEVTRHRHPLAQDRPVADGIVHERRLLTSLRDEADLVIDTAEWGRAN